ncbi:MAG: cell wall hydrolase [Oscillospiraceae bacterium]|jgi:N-acetylmuramoyl-L-alanine amidase|nr:cell wall hydrolase [Oscillospiraceae bacterium]
MKTLIASTLAVLLLTMSPIPLRVVGFSASRVTVLVSGFPESVSTEPSAFYGETREGTSYADARDLAEALGAEIVAGGDDSDFVTITAPELELTAKTGDVYIVANGRFLYAPNGVFTEDGKFYLPVRQTARAFGANVQWSDAFRTVLITPGDAPIEPADTAYSEEDIKWLSRIIFAEAGGESFDGMLGVGNVVMNRVHSEYYPDSVYGVIFDRRSGVQFTPAYSGAINNTPSEACVIAAKLAIDGADVVGESLYFSGAERCWASRHRNRYTTIGGHDFYL